MPFDHNAVKQKWKVANPDKRKAHYAVRNALRRGDIKRQPCYCGEVDTEAHHEDYSKPLEIEWLCKKHHEERHH